MKKAEVIAYFGGTQTAVARALNCTKSAVSQWDEIKPIPLKQALRAQAASNGQLLVDMSLYQLPELPRRARSVRRHLSA